MPGLERLYANMKFYQKIMDEISLPHQIFLCLLQEDDAMVIDSDTDMDCEEDPLGEPETLAPQDVAAAAEVKPAAEATPAQPAGSSLPKMTAVKQVPALKPDTVKAAPACPKAAAEGAADMEWKRKRRQVLASTAQSSRRCLSHLLRQLQPQNKQLL